MRFSARAFKLSFLFGLTAFFFILSPQAYAQYNSAQNTSYPTPTQTLQYPESRVDPNIPQTQHVRVQLMLMDILSAVVCQLGGIDPVDPSKPCLTVDPTTRKIGYSPAQFDESGTPRIGGLLGTSTHLIGMMYTPTTSTSYYVARVSENFGIVKKAHAQDVGYGFKSLEPVMVLWTAVRNFAYFLLMVAFVIIGLGVMLRVKLDPRSVMSLQNQIPKIIVCILLITFSYGIAAVMIDAMWLTTYLGINVMTAAGGAETNPIIENDEGVQTRLSQYATATLLSNPFYYVNSVFDTPQETFGGVGNLTDEVAFGLGTFLEEIIRGFFGVTANDSCVGWTGVNFAACIASFFGFIASILMWIVILITILRVLFSIWFTLLKAYTYIIVYTIAAPIFIVMGLLPGKVLGFEKWIRSMLANLAAFPLTVFVLVFARLIMDLFQGTNPDQFIPPLVGQPNLGYFGVLIAFGLFLMTPTMLAMLQESLKVTGTKYGSAIGSGIAAGAAAPKAATGYAWSRLTRKAKAHEYDAGWFRQRWAKWGHDLQLKYNDTTTDSKVKKVVGRFGQFLASTSTDKWGQKTSGGGH